MSDAVQRRLALRVSSQGSITVAQIAGSVDLDEADLFAEQLDRVVAGADCIVVLDLAEMSFIGSAGLGALVSAHKRAGREGREIRLARPNSIVRKVLEATRLNRIMGVYESVEEAAKGL